MLSSALPELENADCVGGAGLKACPSNSSFHLSQQSCYFFLILSIYKKVLVKYY